MAHVLVIEDEPMLARNICESLRLAGHEATDVGSGEDGLAAVEQSEPDVVLLDLRLPGIDGMDVLRELRARHSSASVVVMTAYGNVESAVEAMKGGASDYLTKPLDLQELDLVIDRVVDHRRISANLDYFRRRERADSAIDQIIGQSPPIVEVKRFIERIVSTSALASDMPPSVLLTGETGTGKDLVARAIHYAGPRRNGPFVRVNCAALPDHLVEAELFGYVKGAFTDARKDKRGLVELADGGTIYLDEIGHMNPALQAKLLTILEDRTVRPVGGIRERKINVSIIVATNRDLAEAIQAGEFRPDLYHRVRVLTVHLPPLHARSGDVELLAEHFLRLYAGRFKLPLERFSADAMDTLRRYDWPGNVRELAHVIERATLIADGPLVRAEHLGIPLPPPAGKLHIEVPGDRTLTVDFAEDGPKLEEIEYQIIEIALEHAKYNVSRAARALGISRDAVRYRLRKYQKKLDESSGDEPA